MRKINCYPKVCQKIGEKFKILLNEATKKRVVADPGNNLTCGTSPERALRSPLELAMIPDGDKLVACPNDHKNNEMKYIIE